MKDKNAAQKKAEAAAKEFTKHAKSFDPQGSYTGTAVNDNPKPVQDADDL